MILRTPLTDGDPTPITSPAFRPEILNIPDNVSSELLIYGKSKPDVISLAQGDGSLPTPDFICDAAYGAMKEGKTHYGPVLGQTPLKTALSDYYKDNFKLDITPERLFVTSSGTTSLHLAINSIIGKGDEVVCITPIWRNIMGIISLSGGTGVQVPLDYESGKGWSLDMDKFLAAITPRTKALLIVSPSNPTGWVMSREEMQVIVDFARARGIWIIADAVYNRLAYGHNTAPDFLELTTPDDLIYSVNSFSKSWAMTGWRLGWLVGPKMAEPVIRNMALYENMGPPTFNQYGGVAALQQGEDFIQHQMKIWDENRQLLNKRLGDNKKIEYTQPDSTFYSFFKIKGNDDCVSICRRLIDEAGVSVAPGCSFGNDFAGWIRLCFAVSKDELTEALNRIEKILS